MTGCRVLACRPRAFARYHGPVLQAGRQATTAGELDMFAEEINPEAFNAIEPVKQGAGAAHAAGLADSYDDIEGYYKITVRIPGLHCISMLQGKDGTPFWRTASRVPSSRNGSRSPTEPCTLHPHTEPAYLSQHR